MPENTHNSDPRHALKLALEAITPDMRVVVCGHTRPDGDAVGSVLALTHALHLRGISAVQLLADNATPPAPYEWMSGYDAYVRPEDYLRDVGDVGDASDGNAGSDGNAASDGNAGSDIDLFIALDSPNSFRLNAAVPLQKAARKTLLIDHHPPLDETYADLRYTDPAYAATGQLLWSLFGDWGWERDARIATACYVATLSDSGSFQFSNTTKQTFFDASEMIAAGAEPGPIAQKLYNKKPLAALQLEGRILSRARLLNNGAVVHSYLSDADLQELKVSTDWTENLIDLIRSTRDTQVALFVTHSSKGPRVSLRGTDFDVSAVAAQFGGGGHKVAAGISWPEKRATREEILEALLPLLPHNNESNAAP